MVCASSLTFPVMLDRRLAAILTDPHFWAPAFVLIAGVGVLVWVHG
jgi:hypothetical protein